MFPNWLLVTISISYIGLLFLMAFLGDKYREKLFKQQHTIIYSLSLGVYCTSWGFLGTAGQAADNSFSYLPVYIAPVLLFIFAWPFIQRIIRVCLKLNITSIADLLAARFGKSQQLAMVVTFVALFGTLPYIALQLKAIVNSYEILRQDHLLSSWQLGLVVSFILAGFTIIFGVRAIDVTERHPGMMLAIAFESFVKLVAYLTIGVFVSFFLFDSPMEIWRQSSEMSDTSTSFNYPNMVSMFGLLFIVTSAFLCLPRQFQVLIVELKEQKHAIWSRWTFPLYILVFAFFATPLGQAGNILYGDSMQSDAYVLFLPAFSGDAWLGLFSFLGAISAASSMVIISTIALSTMLSNEVVFPTLFKVTNIQSTNFHKFRSHLLNIRKALILVVIFLSYGMFLVAPPDTLASLGEVAFGAIAQIGPALFAAFLWRRVTLVGVLSGIISGFSLWFCLNLLPQLGLYSHPFAGSEYSMTTMATLLGLFVNITMIWLLSSFTRQSVHEQMQIAHFIERPDLDKLQPNISRQINPTELELLAARFVGKDKAAQGFHGFFSNQVQPVTDKASYNQALIFYTENMLASVMGSASARLVISCALNGRDIAIEDVAQLVEQASSHRTEFSRSVLHSAIENASEGISVIDKELNLVAWNQHYLNLFNYPEELVYIGSPVSQLIEYNLSHSHRFQHDLQQQVERRLNYLRQGSRHSTERIQPDGKTIRIEGNPIPDGGFVMIFSDITMYREAEKLLKEKNLDLEARVFERTKKLEQANLDLEKSNQELADALNKIEQAHQKKSQYLKACSHDLLQPLSAARLFSSAFVQDSQLTVKQQQQIGYIDNSLQVANELLLDLNEVSRIESGTVVPEITEFALQELIDSLVDEFGAIAQSSQVKFRHITTKMWVRSDKTLLRRILQNLISNAFRYAGDGTILLGYRRQEDKLSIQVVDDGPGIPTDKQAVIFEQFTRLQHSGHEGVNGLGLGLNIAQGLAHILSHRLTLSSNLGQGSIFSLQLDTVQPHQITTSKTPVDILTLSGVHVLCVDNDPNVLAGMVELLQSWKCHVYQATSAQQAKTLFSQHAAHIDIVLMDYQLEDNQNGLNLMQQLQAESDLPLPAILITATIDEAVVLRAKEMGYGYLRKIIKPIALRAVMSATLARSLRKNYAAPPTI
ncbi:hybrid sensor histidine kinase/response regulator [Shewanella sp. Isolate13]|uniref:PAS domain-containing hybrid sensor histidine kinase/response regulator n=1 Tax=Shewanella sp. Isolate13 TaxID=2908531 RepID=UPI001EFDCD86|nr:PAS domain-containing hybrid sensor histidine kinase/response regulator [Shewanella sp. Isolate13]MCG9730471.1 hybrid sensor histidine kinase/response regulator [Shewanella sp. Isolate13]